eukprot:TRINITY_DN7830_c0_g1_i1.p2 TRINITY_DN7830_c0_g1~~TRINITY_DN7830_c0_g1_i1.p2  ORF type:complete len:236 (+),score=67.65 TRINITY_DN7830_c0_g1_i1:39-710(+)
MCIRDRSRNMSEPKYVIGCWVNRGGGEFVRLTLELCGIQYENKKYTNPDDWFKVDKPALNTVFPNLPYLKVGDKVLTEVASILVHACLVSNREDLWGKTVEDRVWVQTLIGAFGDVRMKMFANCQVLEDYLVSGKKNLEESVRPCLKKAETILGDKEFLTGYVTLADMFLFEMIEHALAIDEKAIEDMPKLVELHKRFLALPSISAYRNSDRFQAKPFINKVF